jgi:hypothetical protein
MFENEWEKKLAELIICCEVWRGFYIDKIVVLKESLLLFGVATREFSIQSLKRFRALEIEGITLFK